MRTVTVAVDGETGKRVRVHNGVLIRLCVAEAYTPSENAIQGAFQRVFHKVGEVRSQGRL